MWSSRPFVIALLAVCGWLSPVPRIAQASPPPDPIAIELDPGASCVREASLAPQVAAWLGERAIEPGLRVSVRGSAADPRDVAFQVRRGDEVIATRRFAPAPFVCAQLEATLALAIAMALQASLKQQLLQELGGGGPAPAPARRDSVSLGVRAGFELLPRRSFGGQATFMREFADRFGLRTGLSIDGARNARLAGERGRFHTLLLSAELSGCAVFALGSHVRARGCLGAALGSLRAAGRGYEGARTDWVAWIAVTNELGLSLHARGPLWIDVPIGLTVPVNDVGFQVVDASGQPTSRLSLSVLALTVGLATQLRF